MEQDIKTYDSLRLVAADRGGYMVMTSGEERGMYMPMLFAGPLAQCLSFIGEAIRPDPRDDRPEA